MGCWQRGRASYCRMGGRAFQTAPRLSPQRCGKARRSKAPGCLTASLRRSPPGALVLASINVEVSGLEGPSQPGCLALYDRLVTWGKGEGARQGSGCQGGVSRGALRIACEYANIWPCTGWCSLLAIPNASARSEMITLSALSRHLQRHQPVGSSTNQASTCLTISLANDVEPKIGEPVGGVHCDTPETSHGTIPRAELLAQK